MLRVEALALARPPEQSAVALSSEEALFRRWIARRLEAAGVRSGDERDVGPSWRISRRRPRGEVRREPGIRHRRRRDEHRAVARGQRQHR